MNDARLSVLLVEDDDVAAEVVERSFKKNNLDFPIVHALDGREALDILLNVHKAKYISKPYIILLDLNMPGMNGFEFLSTLRNDERIRDSVVFVLTTSSADIDRTNAYKENIAGYMVKSELGPQLIKLIGLIGNYRTAVKLPGDL